MNSPYILKCPDTYNQGFYEGFASGIFLSLAIMVVSMVICGIYYTLKSNLLAYKINVLIDRRLENLIQVNEVEIQHQEAQQQQVQLANADQQEQISRDDNPSCPHED
jgi:hypothetical protein